MKSYDLKDIQLEKISQDRVEKEFPSYVIGYNQENIDVLLDVLKNHNDLITSEVVAMIELLQLSPKIKNYLSDKITKLKTIQPDKEGAEFKDETQRSNFKDWQQTLTFEKEGELN